MQQMNKRVGFDFDKTLTYEDTLLSFFLFCTPKKKLLIKKIKAWYWLILSWIGIVSNSFMKEKLINYFLVGLTKDEMTEKGKMFSQQIKFNQLYYTTYQKKYPDAIILSASFKEMLFPLFSNNILICSEIYYRDGVVHSLKQNTFSKTKVSALAQMQIKELDIFYTDSYADRPVMEIAKKVFLIKGDVLKQIK